MFGLPIPNIPYLREGIVALAVAGLCLPLGYCQGQKSEAARQDAARALANVESVKTDASAKIVAANERATDEALTNSLKEDLLDAIAETPDTVPDAARVQLGCQRLREAGTDTAALPGPCRSGGTSQARPVR